MNYITEYAAEWDRYQAECKTNRYASFDQLCDLQDKAIAEYLIKPFPSSCGNVRCGITIGLGWFPIVIKLCQDIEALKLEIPGEIHFDQVKEKFGGLRVYYTAKAADAETEKLLYKRLGELVAEAEKAADKTCEICGEAGEITARTGWLKATCLKHRV